MNQTKQPSAPADPSSTEGSAGEPANAEQTLSNVSQSAAVWFLQCFSKPDQKGFDTAASCSALLPVFSCQRYI